MINLKKTDFSNSRVLKWFSGKGFYLAICVSLALIGGAGYYAYEKTANSLSNQLNNLSSNTSRNEAPAIQNKPIDTPSPTESPEPKSTNKPESTQPPATVGVSTQPYIMPVNGEIIQPYSNGELVKSTTTGAWQTHNGIDVEATLGDHVKSMTGGTVTAIEEDALWGVCVTVDHGGGVVARYCNLDKSVVVAVNDKVSAGTVLGAIGETADIESADPHHLHFEIKKNGSYVDPVTIIPIQMGS